MVTALHLIFDAVVCPTVAECVSIMVFWKLICSVSGSY
jgi:hypothetical protein